MQLPTQTFTQLVRGAVAAIQGGASGLLDFTVGSILRACTEAFSQTTLWLQGLIVQLLTTTRAATSQGPDLDSWNGDFDLPREEAAAASTQETFGRFSTTLQGLVPIGGTVELADGSQQYTVVVDTTNPAYSAALSGYVLAPGVATVNAPIKAAVAGAAANCIAGAINTITSEMPGIDYCTNAAPVENGINAESDVAYRLRFQAYINSLSRAIKAAIRLAVTSVQLNVTCTIIENQGYLGAPQPGFFCVVVNDGSGNPPASLLNACGAAVEAVRGLCITYGIFQPIIVPATVSLSISVNTGFDPVATAAAVQAAIEAYIGRLNLGQSMQWTRLAQLAYDAAPGALADVSNIRLNGGETDLVVDLRRVIQLTSTTVQTQ